MTMTFQPIEPLVFGSVEACDGAHVTEDRETVYITRAPVCGWSVDEATALRDWLTLALDGRSR